jgi:hypothetical protein
MAIVYKSEKQEDTAKLYINREGGESLFFLLGDLRKIFLRYHKILLDIIGRLRS